MTPRDVGWVPVVLLGALLVLAPVAAWAGGASATPTAVSECQTLDQPGTTYVLQADITDTTASTCFEVTANDVVLDGNGHTVDGTGSNSIAVDAGDAADGITIRELTVSEFDTAVVFNGVTGGRVEHLTTSDLAGQGVFLGSSPDAVVTGATVVGAGDEGILIWSGSTDAVIRNVHIENAGKEGIFVSVTDANATIAGTVVTGSARDGIRLATSSSTVIRDTEVRNAGGHGILVETSGETLTNTTVRSSAESGVAVTGVSGVSITDLTTTANANAGLTVTDAGSATISDVTATDNGGDGVVLGRTDAPDVSGVVGRRNDLAGLRLDRSDGASITSVTATNNTRGVVLNDTSGTSLETVTTSGNTEWAYHASSGSSDNELRDLTLDTATVSLPEHADVAVKPSPVPGGVPDGTDDIGAALNVTATDSAGLLGNSGSFAFVNVSYTDGDVDTVVESSLRMYGHDGEWTEVEGTNGVDTADNVVFANVTFDTSGLDSANVYAPLGNLSGNVVTTCGEIDAAGRWVLDANLSASGTCLAVTADDVELDGLGHRLSGDGSGTGVVVNESVTNVTVSNLNASGFGRGVALQNVSDVTIDVTVANNAGSGVLVNATSDATIRADATGNGGGDLLGLDPLSATTAGVLVVDAQAVTVADGALTDNADDGVRVLRGSDVIVRNITATGNANGITLVNTTGAELRAVNASNNDVDGVRFDDTTGAVLADSTAVGNGEWSVRGVNGAGDDPIRSLSVGSATVTVETWHEVAIGPTAESDRPPDPADGNLSSLGVYVNATATAADGFAALGVAYDDDGVDESALALYRYNGSAWVALNSTVDATANVVTANVTEFSAFAPFENTSAAAGDGTDGGDGGGGGDGTDGGNQTGGDGGGGTDGGDGATPTPTPTNGSPTPTNGSPTPTDGDDGTPTPTVASPTPTDGADGGGLSPGGFGGMGLAIGGLAVVVTLGGAAYYLLAVRGI